MGDQELSNSLVEAEYAPVVGSYYNVHLTGILRLLKCPCIHAWLLVNTPGLSCSEAWITLVTILWIRINKKPHAICWIVIYPVDIVIHL